MLRSHEVCVTQADEEGTWLPEEADLDERDVVSTFSEKDSGLNSDRV